MTRQKVKLALIENETTRKTTFKKRKGGLLKKAGELATLCDVPVCVLIDSPFQVRPEVWPSRQTMEKVVSDWKMLPVMEQTKKMLNQETFTQQRTNKAMESLKKVHRENREMELQNVLFNCISEKTSLSSLERNDLLNLDCVIDQYLKDVNRKSEMLKKNDESSSSSVVVVAATTTYDLTQTVEVGSSSGSFYNRTRDQTENNLNVKQIIKDFDLNKSSSEQMD